MKSIVFASNNAHKLEEVRSVLGHDYQVLSLFDIGCKEEIAETSETIMGNALLKARYINQTYGYDCFADDTGLEVYALNNAPGVYSARYAGESKDSNANIQKLLQELQQYTDRRALFRTVIALILDREEYLFEGVVTGCIIDEKRGCTGFGYDPVFIPDGYQQTFAEMGQDRKNEISHRAIAVLKLKSFLIEMNNKDFKINQNNDTN